MPLRWLFIIVAIMIFAVLTLLLFFPGLFFKRRLCFPYLFAKHLSPGNLFGKSFSVILIPFVRRFRLGKQLGDIGIELLFQLLSPVWSTENPGKGLDQSIQFTGAIYRDGIQVASGTILNAFATNTPLAIGGVTNNLFRFNGFMSDFRVYSGILTQAQILGIFNE